MINIWIVIGILFIHWFADFVCQTDEQAIGKSKNWRDLLSHTIVYSLWWMNISMVMIMVTDNYYLLLFSPITFICHTVTDFYTSRVNNQLWEQKKVHQFFVSIGFDQWLHYVQLLLTYYLLTK
jgi:uncharacterized protein DUF3307